MVVIVVAGVFVGVAVVLGIVRVVLVLLEDLRRHCDGWSCDPRPVFGIPRVRVYNREWVSRRSVIDRGGRQ